jgi:hypothetical protein
MLKQKMKKGPPFPAKPRKKESNAKGNSGAVAGQCHLHAAAIGVNEYNEALGHKKIHRKIGGHIICVKQICFVYRYRY